MKFYYIILFFIFGFFFVPFNYSNSNIQNTTWIHQWDNKNSDYFKFTNVNHVEFYSAEVGKHIFGKYQDKGSYIIAHFNRADDSHDFYPYSYTIKISNDTLRITRIQFDKYEPESNISNEYFFIKKVIPKKNGIN